MKNNTFKNIKCTKFDVYDYKYIYSIRNLEILLHSRLKT